MICMIITALIVFQWSHQQGFAAEQVQVKTLLNGANLYSEDYLTVVNIVPKNGFVLILEEQEVWSKVSYQNEIGYVKNAALSHTKPTLKRVVSQSSPIVRLTNEKHAQQIGTLELNTFVTVYADTENGFSLIQSGDFFGYVYSTVLATPSITKMVVHDKKGAAVRQLTDMSQPISTTLVHKTVVDVYSLANGWAFIQADGIKGYVIDSKLKAITVQTGKYNVGVVSTSKRVALTFDDGPHPKVTRQILETLNKYNALATFFITGRRVEISPTVLKEIAAAGHEIGNHTYNHPKLTTLKLKEAKSQIDLTNKLVKSIIGIEPSLFRPPYGAYNEQIQAQLEVPLIMWSVDTLDWQHRNPQKLLQNVKAQTKNGSIILMHDVHQTTADGLDAVLAYLTQQGYEFVTVSEILN